MPNDDILREIHIHNHLEVIVIFIISIFLTHFSSLNPLSCLERWLERHFTKYFPLESLSSKNYIIKKYIYLTIITDAYCQSLQNHSIAETHPNVWTSLYPFTKHIAAKIPDNFISLPWLLEHINMSFKKEHKGPHNQTCF